MNYILETLIYVTTAPFFWQAMGFLVATAMFIGALLYDGLMSMVGKGIVTIISYAAIMLMVNVSRITPVLDEITPGHIPQAFAGTATIILSKSA